MGVVVGALVKRNGYLRDIWLIIIPEDYYNYEGREKDSFQPRLIVDGEEQGSTKAKTSWQQNLNFLRKCVISN